MVKFELTDDTVLTMQEKQQLAEAKKKPIIYDFSFFMLPARCRKKGSRRTGFPQYGGPFRSYCLKLNLH